jgi:transcriptional regulator with XRE-family HTH domain
MIQKQDSATELRALINKTNVTQTDVAKKTGVSLGLVGQWLRGERPISVAKSLDIEAAFKIDAAKLSNDVFLVRNAKRVRLQK